MTPVVVCVLFALLAVSTQLAEGILTKSSECSQSLGCITDPESTIMLTWRSTPSDVQFVLRAYIGDGDMYAAMGLSQDIQMGEDDVTECVHYKGAVSVMSSYNMGKANTRYNDGVLSGTSGVYSQGVIECYFTRPISVIASSKRYDLSRDWYILLVWGRLQPGTDMKLKHVEKSASPFPISLLHVGSFQTQENSKALIHLHGCLMILAWVTVTSVSVTVARHYRGLLPHTEVFGKRLWFQLHRTMMVSVLVLTAIGFIVIFVQVGGFVDANEGKAACAHAILGIIVMQLTILNPIIALFRPTPNSQRRPVFNWIHRGVGIAAKILAVVTMFVGLNLDDANAPASMQFVLGAFVIWHIVVNLIPFAVTAWKKKSEDYEDFRKASTHSYPVTANRQTSNDGISQPKVSGFQEILLILHSAVAIVTCILLWSLFLTNHGDDHDDE